LSVLPDSEPVARPEIETARTVIYPWQCDVMGHLATQNYMRIFDDATYHLLARLGYVLRDARSRLNECRRLDPGPGIV
jgi:acyl-CoA thioesterase FadM